MFLPQEIAIERYQYRHTKKHITQHFFYSTINNYEGKGYLFCNKI